MNRIINTIILWVFACGVPVFAQVTGPSVVDHALGVYQVSGENVSGTVLDSYGWNIAKKQELTRAMRARVRVSAISGNIVTYQIVLNYFGLVDTVTQTVSKSTAFWFPDTSATIPDSLIYIVPDTTDMAVGDEFSITSSRVNPGDYYETRLIFSTDTIKGTASVTSQPVWIGDGVSNAIFAVNPTSSVATVYFTNYAMRYRGPYIYYSLADTLADSTWTIDSTSAGAWNYRTVSGINSMRWMQITRVGKVAADTVPITGESVIIQSK